MSITSPDRVESMQFDSALRLGRHGSFERQNAKGNFDAVLRDLVARGPGFKGTGTLVKGGAVKAGDLVTTRIFLDLTGLASVATDNDIIGVASAGAAYFTRITTKRNGTVVGGYMRCLEAPAVGEPDINVYAATEATGAQGDLITGLTETQIVDAAADWTLNLTKALTAVPAAGQYLYLACGNGATPDAGTYTAGKFLIELYGYDA